MSEEDRIAVAMAMAEMEAEEFAGESEAVANVRTQSVLSALYLPTQRASFTRFICWRR